MKDSWIDFAPTREKFNNKDFAVYQQSKHIVSSPQFPLPSAIASDSVHDRIISSRLTSTSPRSESPVGTFSPSDDAEPPLAPPSSYAGKQLPPALASSTAAAVNMRRSYSTPTLRPGTLPRHPPPSHPPRVASQGSAPAPPSNAPRAGQGELDIYAYCRPLSASSIKGTDAWRQALADIGIGEHIPFQGCRGGKIEHANRPFPRTC